MPGWTGVRSASSCPGSSPRPQSAKRLSSASWARRRAYTKELELYTLSPPLADSALADEVAGLLRWAGRAGLERFHLYGHSGGGTVGLAFTAAHPEQVLSLTLEEAAFDLSAEMHADLAEHRELQRLMLKDPAEAMPRFMQLELKPGVEFTTSGAPPLPNRPAGITALLHAFEQHTIDTDALRRFKRPVLYTRGTLSADRYELKALSRREREVVGVLLEGLDTRAACERLFISPHTLQDQDDDEPEH